MLAPGTRVRITAPHFLLTLRSDLGTVVSAEHYDSSDYDDWYIVHLDEPAIYHESDGRFTDLSEIREYEDNLEVLP